MPDLANSDTNRSSSFGRTGNAYDVRFSPGGSSGGIVTAIAANMAVLGNGTDTGNSIRMPAATSALVGVFPTRGLVSIAGIAPLDWLLDNTGPIARTVADAAIALAVMAGEDPLDPRNDGRAWRRAASAAGASLSQRRGAQGQAVRCAGVRSRRGRRAVSWHPAERAGGGRREAANGCEHSTQARDARDVHESCRRPARRRRRGGVRRRHPAGELREDGKPCRDLRLHAGRDESLPRGIRTRRVPLGRGLSEGRRRAALHVVHRRGG